MTGQQPKRHGNVVPLNHPHSEPSRARLATVQQWHQDRASSEDQAVAAMHMCITATGEIQTDGICIEPEHAQAMLEAMPNLIARLEVAAGLQPTQNQRPKRLYQLMSRGIRGNPAWSGHTILWQPNNLGKTGYLDALQAFNSGRF